VKYSSIAQGLYRGTRAISQAANSVVATGAHRLSMQRASRFAATGVLAPGDPDPPPTGPSEYFDYRGTASERELRHLRDGEFSLGRFLDPRRGPRGEIGLPFGVLRRHAAVLGPTGSGKTKSVLVPWIATALRQGCCVVAVDIGGDLLADLQTHRSVTGPLGAKVSKWDYSDPSQSARWNWLEALDTDEAVVAAVDAIHGKLRFNDSQPFFHQRDARVLRGLIELARSTGSAKTGGELLRLLRDQSRLRTVAGFHPSDPGSGRLNDVIGLNPGEYMKAVSGVVNDLEMWDNPGLDTVTNTSTGINLNVLFDEPRLLVVGAPIHGGRISEAASSLLLSQVVNRLYRRFATNSGVHTFLVLDEAARLVSRLPVEELLSVSRKARVSVVLATQDVGQFADESERLAILGNCSTYISLPTPSRTNAEYLAGRLGQRFQSSISLTHSPGTQSSPGISRSAVTNTVPVLGPREIMHPPFGERVAIVHSPQVSGKPFLTDLTRPEW